MQSTFRILKGDCLDLLPRLGPPEADLVYMDPPFKTGRTRQTEHVRFSDHWRTMDEYLDFIRPRIVAVIERLHEHGIILIHCDWRTSHHLRLMLESLLGEAAFVNHLVWRYGLGGSSPRRFARKHDDILFYARSADYYFDPPMVPATSRRMAGRAKKATDVLDIPSINNLAAERVGYPTQKPLALLRLLVNACCPPGGVVIDPFCGSGTTLIAALESGRSAIGIDTSRDAVRIARSRCEAMQRSVANPAGEVLRT